MLKTIEPLGDEQGKPLNFAPTAGLDIYTNAAGANIGFAVSGKDLYCIDLASVNADLPIGTQQKVVAQRLPDYSLTGPYFHNGSRKTLEEVVEFYNRGGDRRGPDGDGTTGFGANRSNLDPDITVLNLTEEEKAALVAFLKNALTDERVRWEQAPFDHPEILIPNGHPGSELQVQFDPSNGAAVDALRIIPASGRYGRRVFGPLKPFDEALGR